MHQFIALLQHVHRELYLLGPDIVPITLSKYRTYCAVLICGSCLCAAATDSLRNRWFPSALWVLAAALLFIAFRVDGMLWNPEIAAALAGSAILFATVGALSVFWYELQRYLRHARRERRRYRRIPGTAGAPLPGTGPRQTRNSSRP